MPSENAGPEAVTTTLTHDELRELFRAAVRDAILDVLGTLALLGFSLLFLAVGARTLLKTSGPWSFAGGGGALGLSLLLVAIGFDVPRRIRPSRRAN